MANSLGRFATSPAAAWLVAAILLVLLIAQVAGVIHWPAHKAVKTANNGNAKSSESARKTDNAGNRNSALAYSKEDEELSDADRSQPLHMHLEGQFPGPLKDTTIERWRDPVDGTICYIYMPIAVSHSAGPKGLVQYGSANIGSISCFHERYPEPLQDQK